MSGLLAEARARLLASGALESAFPTGQPELTIRPLSPGEALGTFAGQETFALARGREVLLEARVADSVGQAFTAWPSPWSGSLEAWLELDPEHPVHRPWVLAGLNALVRHCKLGEGPTRHCRNDGPARCGQTMEDRLRQMLAAGGKLLLVGFQPAILSAATRALGAERVRVLDLQPENVGRCIEGVRVLDGERDLDKALPGVRLALVTGSSWANGTFDHIAGKMGQACIPIVLFGTSASGPAALMKLERWCFEGE